MTDETKLLRLPAVLQRTGLGRSTLYRLVATGGFVKPIRISGTSISAWSSHDVDAWIREQLNGAA